MTLWKLKEIRVVVQGLSIVKFYCLFIWQSFQVKQAIDKVALLSSSETYLQYAHRARDIPLLKDLGQVPGHGMHNMGGWMIEHQNASMHACLNMNPVCFGVG
jgi:hypothetical protein